MSGKNTKASTAAEERIVALAIRQPDLVEKSGVRPQDFFHDDLRDVLLAALSVQDPVAIHRKLGGRVSFERITDISKLAASPDQLDVYSKEVSEAAVQRRVLAVAENIQRNAGLIAPLELAELSRQALSSISAGADSAVSAASDLISDRLERVEELAKRKWAGEDVLTGVPTGVKALDAFLGGYPRGVVTTVGALPGMGKSSLGKACALASAGGRFGLHLFSLEDARDPYSDRILAELSGVSSDKIRALDITQQDVIKLKKANDWLKEKATWLVDDRRGLTPAEMCREVRKHASRNKTDIVLLDYIQQVRSSNSKADERQCIDEAVTAFANLAREMNIAVVVFSQLNRSFLQQKSEDGDMDAKKPKLHHLKWSGKIGEESKCVLLLHRDHYHDRGIPDDRMEIIVAKNNQGKCGSVLAGWNPEKTKVF